MEPHPAEVSARGGALRRFVQLAGSGLGPQDWVVHEKAVARHRAERAVWERRRQRALDAPRRAVRRAKVWAAVSVATGGAAVAGAAEAGAEGLVVVPVVAAGLAGRAAWRARRGADPVPPRPAAPVPPWTGAGRLLARVERAAARRDDLLGAALSVDEGFERDAAAVERSASAAQEGLRARLAVLAALEVDGAPECQQVGARLEGEVARFEELTRAAADVAAATAASTVVGPAGERHGADEAVETLRSRAAALADLEPR